jgi:hypothetical protein
MPKGVHGKNKPHGPKRGTAADLKKRTYHSWHNMLARCYNASHVSYKEYGGRGIRVFTPWCPNGEVATGLRTHAEAFANFVRDVGIKPTPIHTLDRLKPNLHYTPDNVKWSTPKEQGVNKRDTHFVAHPTTGAEIAAATLADELKISYQALRARMMKLGTWYALRTREGQGLTVNPPGKETNTP